MNPKFSLLLFWLILGFSPIIGGLSVNLISPVFLVLLASIMGFVYFLFPIIKNKQFRAIFEKKYILKYFLISNLGNALPFCAMLYALKWTTPANIAILNQVEMLYSLLFCAVFLKEKITLKQLMSSFFIITGATILMFEGRITPHLKGDLIVVFCVWMFQASHILIKKLPREINDNLICATKNFYSIPVLIILLFLFEAKPVFNFNFSLLIVLIYMGIIRYGLSYNLWVYAIRNLELSKTTAVALSFPALTLVLSVIFGYDKFSLFNISGLILTMAGALWLNKLMNKKI
ncbi:MAG: DMT family transporter [Elusimicrobiaceae bacterium]|nr:DMT family transporter [Elusimicrobiaceae bacterium]